MERARRPPRHCAATPPTAANPLKIPTVFDLCTPRREVLGGRVAEADLAADLAAVLRGDAPADYREPARFFENTHPTRGLKRLLEHVYRRLSGAGGEAAAIFRLDTSFGGAPPMSTPRTPASRLRNAPVNGDADLSQHARSGSRCGRVTRDTARSDQPAAVLR